MEFCSFSSWAILTSDWLLSMKEGLDGGGWEMQTGQKVQGPWNAGFTPDGRVSAAICDDRFR
jgi:hypothetical protein